MTIAVIDEMGCALNCDIYRVFSTYSNEALQISNRFEAQHHEYLAGHWQVNDTAGQRYRRPTTISISPVEWCSSRLVT